MSANNNSKRKYIFIGTGIVFAVVIYCITIGPSRHIGETILYKVTGIPMNYGATVPAVIKEQSNETDPLEEDKVLKK